MSTNRQLDDLVKKLSALAVNAENYEVWSDQHIAFTNAVDANNPEEIEETFKKLKSAYQTSEGMQIGFDLAQNHPKKKTKKKSKTKKSREIDILDNVIDSLSSHKDKDIDSIRTDLIKAKAHIHSGKKPHDILKKAKLGLQGISAYTPETKKLMGDLDPVFKQYLNPTKLNSPIPRKPIQPIQNLSKQSKTTHSESKTSQNFKNLREFSSYLKENFDTSLGIPKLVGLTNRLINAKAQEVFFPIENSPVGTLKNQIDSFLNEKHFVKRKGKEIEVNPLLKKVLYGEDIDSAKEDLNYVLSDEFKTHQKSLSEAHSYYNELQDSDLEEKIDEHETQLLGWVDWFENLPEIAKSEVKVINSDLKKHLEKIKKRKAAMGVYNGQYAEYLQLSNEVFEEFENVENSIGAVDSVQFKNFNSKSKKFFNDVLEVVGALDSLAKKIKSLEDDGSYKSFMEDHLKEESKSGKTKRLVKGCRRIQTERNRLAFRFGEPFLKRDQSEFVEIENDVEVGYDQYLEEFSELENESKNLTLHEEEVLDEESPFVSKDVDTLSTYKSKFSGFKSLLEKSIEKRTTLNVGLGVLYGLHDKSEFSEFENELNNHIEKTGKWVRILTQNQKNLSEEIGRRYAESENSLLEVPSYRVEIVEERVNDLENADENYIPITIDSQGRAELSAVGSEEGLIYFAENDLEKAKSKAKKLIESNLLTNAQKTTLSQLIEEKESALKSAQETVSAAEKQISEREERDTKELKKLEEHVKSIRKKISQNAWAGAGEEFKHALDIYQKIDFELIGEEDEFFQKLSKFEEEINRMNPEMRAERIISNGIPEYSDELPKRLLEENLQKISSIESEYRRVENELDSEPEGFSDFGTALVSEKSKFEARIGKLQSFVEEYQSYQETVIEKIKQSTENGLTDSETAVDLFRSIQSLNEKLDGWEKLVDEESTYQNTIKNLDNYLKNKYKEMVQNARPERTDSHLNRNERSSSFESKFKRKYKFEELKQVKKQLESDLETIPKALQVAKNRLDVLPYEDQYESLRKLEESEIKRLELALNGAENAKELLEKKLKGVAAATTFKSNFENYIDALREPYGETKGFLRKGELHPKNLKENDERLRKKIKKIAETHEKLKNANAILTKKQKILPYLTAAGFKETQWKEMDEIISGLSSWLENETVQKILTSEPISRPELEIDLDVDSSHQDYFVKSFNERLRRIEEHIEDIRYSKKLFGSKGGPLTLEEIKKSKNPFESIKEFEILARDLEDDYQVVSGLKSVENLERAESLLEEVKKWRETISSEYTISRENLPETDSLTKYAENGGYSTEDFNTAIETLEKAKEDLQEEESKAIDIEIARYKKKIEIFKSNNKNYEKMLLTRSQLFDDLLNKTTISGKINFDQLNKKVNIEKTNLKNVITGLKKISVIDEPDLYLEDRRQLKTRYENIVSRETSTLEKIEFLEETYKTSEEILDSYSKYKSEIIEVIASEIVTGTVDAFKMLESSWKKSEENLKFEDEDKNSFQVLVPEEEEYIENLKKLVQFRIDLTKGNVDVDVEDVNEALLYLQDGRFEPIKNAVELIKKREEELGANIGRYVDAHLRSFLTVSEESKKAALQYKKVIESGKPFKSESLEKINSDILGNLEKKAEELKLNEYRNIGKLAYNSFVGKNVAEPEDDVEKEFYQYTKGLYEESNKKFNILLRLEAIKENPNIDSQTYQDAEILLKTDLEWPEE